MVGRAGEGAGDEEGWSHTLWGRRRRGGSVARNVEALATRKGLVAWMVQFSNKEGSCPLVHVWSGWFIFKQMGSFLNLEIWFLKGSMA